MPKRENEERIAANVAKLMSDSRMNWARGPVAIRVISLATVAASLVTPIAFLVDPIFGLLSAAVMFLGYFILRGATRGIAEIPARFLDERQLALRNSIYVKSYQTLASLLGLLTVAAFVVSISADVSGNAVAIALSYNQIQAFVWLFLGPITIIPTVSVALAKGRK
jgi:hypothetical protein